jgi:hypothetical protein
MISTKRNVLFVLKDQPLISLNMFAHLSPQQQQQILQLLHQHLAQVDNSGMVNNVSLVTYLNIGIITPIVA